MNIHIHGSMPRWKLCLLPVLMILIRTIFPLISRIWLDPSISTSSCPDNSEPFSNIYQVRQPLHNKIAIRFFVLFSIPILAVMPFYILNLAS